MKRKVSFLLMALLLGAATRLINAEGTMAEVKLEKATFAGGCFWCMEPPFDKIPGVKSTTSGYIGGMKENPTYEEVSSGSTGHCEALEVAYNPDEVRYETLLDAFWKNIDPTTKDAQFADHGSQYRTGIFYHNEEQRKLAEASRDALGKSGHYDKPIVTEITAASKFYPAENYHQDYYKKNPLRYKYYHFASGRGQYLKKVWGDEGKKE
ncbi:MAG: peptide-methionine (S)-S-oxide reductase MsrA [Candidatus Omnitrophota bacterium]|nr:peptide-methionine (S)-S-oxide reductase MsrA [Candidatus Omnitrophota bacterium]